MPGPVTTTAPTTPTTPAPDPNPLSIPSLDDQLRTLRALGVRPDRDRLAGLWRPGDLVVVHRDELPVDSAMEETVDQHGRHGFVGMTGAKPLSAWRPIPEVRLPEAEAWLLRDVSTGPDTFDVPPEQVVPALLAAGRTPLTLEEGVALLLHVPDVLDRANAYSLAGSRSGDRRVAAIWCSRRRPRLGWCWDGAPHSWLGTASAATRLS